MISKPTGLLCLTALAFAAVLTCGLPLEAATPAREYLDEASTATIDIELPGDQSNALRLIALALVELDPLAAVQMVPRMRRPSDAARALGAVAVAVAEANPEEAADSAAAAGRLLMRISDSDQRAAEQELLLREIAALGEDALPAAPELAAGEARLVIVLALAESRPDQALTLFHEWEFTDRSADEAAAAIAEGFASSNPDQAIELAAGIVSSRIRDFTFWRIAERRPAQEAVDISISVTDALVRSAILASASVREAANDPEQAKALVSRIEVAPESALSHAAAAMAAADVERALDAARALPDRPRAWTLSRIAVAMAGKQPQLVESLLSEIPADSETIRLSLARMAHTDPGRALRLARSLQLQKERDAALSAVACSLAHANPALSQDLLWEIESPHWRAKAVMALAVVLAATDADAATALLGLVSEPAAATRIQAAIAVEVAADTPELAARLLQALPPSDCRNDAVLQAAAVALRAGEPPEEVLSQVTAAGFRKDVALRWLLPSLIGAQTRSPINLAGKIDDTHARALALVAVAQEMLELTPTAKPAPDRAGQIRPIVEWEGR